MIRNVSREVGDITKKGLLHDETEAHDSRHLCKVMLRRRDYGPVDNVIIWQGLLTITYYLLSC
jgi:hypothetical protein